MLQSCLVQWETVQPGPVGIYIKFNIHSSLRVQYIFLQTTTDIGRAQTTS